MILIHLAIQAFNIVMLIFIVITYRSASKSIDVLGSSISTIAVLLLVIMNLFFYEILMQLISAKEIMQILFVVLAYLMARYGQLKNKQA